MTSDANCLTVQGRIPISEIASISSVGICDKAAEKLFFRDVICPCIRHGKKTSIKNLPTICDGFRSISPSRLNAHTHFNFISILSCPLSFTIIHVVICKCSNGRNTSKAFGGFSCFIYSNFFLFQISNLQVACDFDALTGRDYQAYIWLMVFVFDYCYVFQPAGSTQKQ